MKNVLLINPPSPFLLDDRTFPALGILTVAAELKRLGIETEVLDLAGREDYLAELRIWLGMNHYPKESFAITANTPQMPYVYRILQGIRDFRAGAEVIIGGPHASFAPQHCLKLGFSQVVMDDGVEGVRQLVAGNKEKIVRGKLIHLDEYPLPARDAIDMSSYHYILPGTDLPATNVMGSQGCPYRCSFCSGREISFYRKYRTRSPNHILEELDFLDNYYGLRAFQFYDDEVNIQKDWLIALCEAIAFRGYKWRAFIKANLFDDPTARAMAKAGCVEVCTGVESGSDRILKEIIQKETSYAINREARWVAKRHGIRFKAFCMVGNPSETREDIELTKKWLLEAKPDDFDMTILSPMPGSPIYDRAFPDEIRRDFEVTSFPDFQLDFKPRDFAQEASYYKTVPGEYKSWTATPTLSSEDLEQIRDQIDTEVRSELGLPAISRQDISPFEHSYGQGPPPARD